MVREADPVHNVELRHDRHGHESVVFSFPYVREVVDAVRSIPGRRFDWDRKEWWALQADGTAPYVKGVIERHEWLKVHPDVRAWLAEAVTGWVGKVGAQVDPGLKLEEAAGRILDLGQEHGDDRELAAGALRLGLPVEGELDLALLPGTQARRADEDGNRAAAGDGLL